MVIFVHLALLFGIGNNRSNALFFGGCIMSEYKLEIKQLVDYPRCRIYRQFIQLLMQEQDICTGNHAGLFHYIVLSCYANFRTSYKRIEGISYTIQPGQWLCRIGELTKWFRIRFHHQAIAILQELQDRHLITYTLLGRNKLVKFSITNWRQHNRAEWRVTSVLRSKTLAQGGFTSPEHVKSPLGRSAALRHGVQKETTDF